MLTGDEGYALWRVTTAQGTHQEVVSIYVLGDFIIKVIIFPVAKAVIVGRFVKRFCTWLRGEKGKAWGSLIGRTPRARKSRPVL
jgi:hypothetical protein